MYCIATEASFDAAHFLKSYNGKCKNIHGHRWRVIIRTKADSLQEDNEYDGMITDFKDIKRDLNSIVDRFDHTLIYEEGSLSKKLEELLIEEGFELNKVNFRPTAENFSRYFFETMKGLGYNITETTVYETVANYASYSEEQANG